MWQGNHFDRNGRFLLDDYDKARPFSSFLPGIAGPMGVPMWVFYVNRGQAITSFGVESKDCPLMEFQPANKAYRLTPFTGFRTFVKIKDKGGPQLYEPFAPWHGSPGVQRQMAIGMNELVLEEANPQLGLHTSVLYFTLVGEPFAGLVRQVTLRNIARSRELHLELLDGAPLLIPYGVDDGALKHIGRTIEAWMEVLVPQPAAGQVDAQEGQVPFFRLRASAEDKPEVQQVVAGHFALAFQDHSGAQHHLLPAFVDPDVVFGPNTALSSPEAFAARTLAELRQAPQFTSGKTPCALFAAEASLQPSDSLTFVEVYGHIGSLDRLPAARARLLAPGYLEQERQEAAALAQQLTEPIATGTTDPIFDAYCRQTFLDNVLRGGWPLLLGDADHPHVYHIYSRKHGDPERDYNAFFLAAEPYSQGNGNYRDVNQNRRSDVLFQPQVGAFNIRHFMSLIQADGYNPLVVQGTTFTLSEAQQANVLAQVEQPGEDALAAVLSRPFTPGSLLKAVDNHGLKLRIPAEAFVALALQNAQQHFEATHGEGYWIDHWTYNLDLIDSYLAVYPDRKRELLFGMKLPFFDSAAIVRPRSEKYVLVAGQPRQLDAVVEDEEKAALIAARGNQNAWARTEHGRGQVFQVTLFEKLVILATLKFATLDPAGMGVEMEAGKPGWYDALNGLPGLFGSSLPETFELQRLLEFLLAAIAEQGPGHVTLPVEAYDLLQTIADRLDRFNLANGENGSFAYWDDVSSAREGYRALVRLGFDGATMALSLADLAQTFWVFLDKVKAGIQRAASMTGGMPPTYFAYEVAAYELAHTDAHAGDQSETPRDSAGRPLIQVQALTPRALPFFLEGPVRAMRVAPAQAAARALHQQVRASDLYDSKLGMLKVNASLAGEPHDIGRARAFTPGWLENESIWLHMAYKYLLALLRAGLFEEFYAQARTGLVPFMDPQVYGRSPLENSSFIVSSAHPDPSLHGAGFVARLSGATAEFLSMWNLITAGPQPFYSQEGALHLALRPALPGWLFDDRGQVRFRFLGHIAVTCHNPQRRDTWQCVPRRTELTAGSQVVELDGDVIGPPYAGRVRAGQIEAIDLFFD